MLGKSALIKFEVGPHHDDGSPRVIHAFSKKVLAESPLLSLEHVRQGLEQSPSSGRRLSHRSLSHGVIDQGVNRFLQHALFVADDDIGGRDFQKILQPVIPIDHPPIQIVQIGRRVSASV